MMMLKPKTEEKAQNAIAAVLRYGSLISTLVMALGVTLAFFRGGAETRSAGLSPGALLMKALEFDPVGITELGILLLLLTPVFRVAIATVAFGLERDHRYVLISLGVLTVMLASMAYALR
jgi:uncharacterized membrane protein